MLVTLYKAWAYIRSFTVLTFIRTSHLQGLSFINFFSCVYGGIRCSHVEIEFGKNSKARHTHSH